MSAAALTHTTPHHEWGPHTRVGTSSCGAKGASSPDSTRFGTHTSRGPLGTSSPASAPLRSSPAAASGTYSHRASRPVTDHVRIVNRGRHTLKHQLAGPEPRAPKPSDLRAVEGARRSRPRVPTTSWSASFLRPQQRNAPVEAAPGTGPRPVSAPLFVVPPVLFKPAHVPVDLCPCGDLGQSTTGHRSCGRSGWRRRPLICMLAARVCVWLSAAPHRGSCPLLLPTRLHPPCAQHRSGHGERESRDFSIPPTSTLPTLRLPCHDRVACLRCWGERAVGASCWEQPRGLGPPAPPAGVHPRHRVCLRGASESTVIPHCRRPRGDHVCHVRRGPVDDATAATSAPTSFAISGWRGPVTDATRRSPRARATRCQAPRASPPISPDFPPARNFRRNAARAARRRPRWAALCRPFVRAGGSRRPAAAAVAGAPLVGRAAAASASPLSCCGRRPSRRPSCGELPPAPRR